MFDADSPIHIYRSDAQLSADAVAQLGGLLAGLDRLDPILTLPTYPETGEVQFGRFKLLSRLGSGRFGVVLLADDPVLGRKVVVKVPKPAVLADPELRQRFGREARAAARLDHPGIVPIMDAGEIGGLPYLVAAYISGPSLAGWLTDHPGPIPPGAAARLVAAIASAVDHAHERGVLHCDLSPSNILLSAEPKREKTGSGPSDIEFAPSVTDFGLARLMEDDTKMTRTYQVAGTPAYMAPEQALGNRRSLTLRADVYALGAILYELVTGVVPFHGASSEEVLERHVKAAPVSPRQVNPHVPRDLAAICLKCLEKEPRDRYGSSAAVAEDLGRFLIGQPVTARPVRLVVRAARWMQRHPVATTFLAAALAITSLAIVVAGRFWANGVRLQAALTVSEHDQKTAEAQTRAADFRATLEQIRQRRTNRTPGWPEPNRADLKRLAAGEVDPQYLPALRTEAAAVATATWLGERRALAEGVTGFTARFSPDSSRLAIGEAGNNVLGLLFVHILQMPGGQEERTFQYFADRAWELRASRRDGTWSLAFSPDGRQIAVGTRSGWLMVWDLSEPKPVLRKRWRQGPVSDGDKEAARRESVVRMAFDSRGWLWSGDDATCIAWDPARGWAEAARQPGILHRPTQTITRPELAGRAEVDAAGPTSEWFVRRVEDELVIVLPNNRQVGRISLTNDARAEDDMITDFAVSPDGLLLASAAEFAGHLKLWDVAGGRLLATRSLNDRGLRLTFSPDGRWLVVVGTNRTWCYEIVRPTAAGAVGLQAFPLDDVDVTPDGRWLATHATMPAGHGLFRVRVQDLKSNGPGPIFERDYAPSVGNSRPRLALHPDGRDVVLHTGEWLERFTFRPDQNAKLSRPRGTREIRYSRDGRLWNADIESTYTWVDGAMQSIRPGGDVTSLAVDEPGAVIGLRDGTIAWYSPKGERERDEKPTEDEVTALARSGDRVVAGTSSGDVYVLERGQAPIVIQDAHTEIVWSAAIGPRGWFATGSADNDVRIWDPAGRPVLTLHHSRPVRRLIWSADGSTLTVLAVGERAARQYHMNELKSAIAGLGLDPNLP